jgi:hypothetical protein
MRTKLPISQGQMKYRNCLVQKCLAHRRYSNMLGFFFLSFPTGSSRGYVIRWLRKTNLEGFDEVSPLVFSCMVLKARPVSGEWACPGRILMMGAAWTCSTFPLH